MEVMNRTAMAPRTWDRKSQLHRFANAHHGNRFHKSLNVGTCISYALALETGGAVPTRSSPLVFLRIWGIRRKPILSLCTES